MGGNSVISLRSVHVALQGSPGRFCHHFLSSFLLTCPLAQPRAIITMAKAPVENPRLHLDRGEEGLWVPTIQSPTWTRLSTNWPLLAHLGDGRLMSCYHPQISPPRRTPFLSNPKAVALFLIPTGLGSSLLPGSFQGSQIVPAKPSPEIPLVIPHQRTSGPAFPIWVPPLDTLCLSSVGCRFEPAAPTEAEQSREQGLGDSPFNHQSPTQLGTHLGVHGFSSHITLLMLTLTLWGSKKNDQVISGGILPSQPYLPTLDLLLRSLIFFFFFFFDLKVPDFH